MTRRTISGENAPNGSEQFGATIRQTIIRQPNRTADCSYPHCSRSTQSVPMSAMAEDPPTYAYGRTAHVPWKQPLKSRRVEGPMWVATVRRGSISCERPMQSASDRRWRGSDGRPSQRFALRTAASASATVVRHGSDKSDWRASPRVLRQATAERLQQARHSQRPPGLTLRPRKADRISPSFALSARNRLRPNACRRSEAARN